MADVLFREWLAGKSWAQCVRYCKAVALLLPPAALLTDAPLLRGGSGPELAWLLAWQAAAEAVCIGLILLDRWVPRLRGREWPLMVFCAVFMVLTTSIGMLDCWLRGDYSIYAAGSTFIAAVACTPRRVRQPMYAISLVALSVPAWDRAGADVILWVSSLVNPFCVVVLCIALDRFTYSRNLALYRETQRAEAEHARADKVLYNVLPASVADELKRNGRVKAVKHENMGVLFADIAGFTRFSHALPPDALVLVLDDIFSSFDVLVDRLGLDKIKTIGDAYMVTSQGRIVELCRLALDLREALEHYNRANGTQLGMRIGIHAGPAVAGVIGVKRFLYDVWGDTVNVANRIEQTGEAGAIHVTHAVYRQTRESFGYRARGPLDIKGRGPVITYWLLEPTAAPGVPEAGEAVQVSV